MFVSRACARGGPRPRARKERVIFIVSRAVALARRTLGSRTLHVPQYDFAPPHGAAGIEDANCRQLTSAHFLCYDVVAGDPMGGERLASMPGQLVILARPLVLPMCGSSVAWIALATETAGPGE